MLKDPVPDLSAILQQNGQTESFSAVSTLLIARVGACFSIFGGENTATLLAWDCQDLGNGKGNFEVPNSQFPGARSLLYRHF